MGTDENPILVSKLINFYASFNLLVDANIVTESSNSLDPLHWNMVISLYVRNIFFEEAISVYKKMFEFGKLDVARHLFDNMSVKDDVSWNTIISCYASRAKQISLQHLCWRIEERQMLRDENRGLQAQLKDTAEAVQAIGELPFRLKEAEEFAINA
ncbi:hypothetical protein KIW84_010167 [Lathyrus oleraceus]|uniref:Pentatricopeptide repeat-containing protein n=1 Tax=Pisum sativum TaxID=3888 RepID=A0A9D4YP84_PEA|nr:hypothetical protein KIW84_010167 [Pisum sativum]